MPASKYHVYRQEWKRLYEEERLTLSAIAKQYGTNGNTVRYQLKKTDTRLRGGFQYKDLRSEWKRLYVEEGWTTTAIAEEYDVSSSTVFSNLNAIGVDTSRRIRPPIERFMEKVEVRPDDCWMWTASTNTSGYGQFAPVAANCWIASRWSYRHFTGHDPVGLFICHRCHKRACVNPDHLYAGDARTNADDRVEAGRVVRGEDHHGAKLTGDEVREIKHRLQLGEESYREIGEDYGVSVTTLCNINLGKRWAHI